MDNSIRHQTPIKDRLLFLLSAFVRLVGPWLVILYYWMHYGARDTDDRSSIEIVLFLVLVTYVLSFLAYRFEVDVTKGCILFFTGAVPALFHALVLYMGWYSLECGIGIKEEDAGYADLGRVLVWTGIVLAILVALVVPDILYPSK